MKVLITGGTGFFGMILKSYLKGQKIKYINPSQGLIPRRLRRYAFIIDA